MEDVDKYRLIEEVRKRPLLWDCRANKPRAEWESQWAEIAAILNKDAITCRETWGILRQTFCTTAHRITARMAKDRQNGIYKPNEKYYTWSFFGALIFIIPGLSAKSKIDLAIFEDQLQAEKEFQNESDTDLKTAESERNFESEDVEFIDNNDLNPTQHPTGYNWSANNSEDNTRQNLTVQDSEDAYFKAYTIPFSKVKTESEELETSNENDSLHSDAELEFQFITNNSPPTTSTNVSNPDLNSCGATSTIQPPDASDEDYSFLYSFLEHIKLMTADQKLDFDTGMKMLLLEILPNTSWADIFSKQLKLPVYEDSDKKILISFWPFTQLMSVPQKLQFRSKMTELALRVLFKETN